MRIAPYLIVLLTAIPGCRDSGRPILLILPNGFMGEFQIVKDSRNGVDPVSRNGEWVFEIPPSGVLKVKDDSPFYRWHKERALYSDGRPVSYESIGTCAGRSPDPNSGESSWEFDGTTHRFEVKQLGNPAK